MMGSGVHELYDRAVRELEAARVRVRDLEGFCRVYAELMGSAFTMPAAPPESTPPAGPAATLPAPTPRPEISLADPGLSISDAAEKVLRHFRRPMKSREIAETMFAWEYPYEGTVQELRASVGGVLSREVRENGIFTRAALGVFGLKEWGGVNVSDDSDEEEDGQTDAGRPDQHPALLLEDESTGEWHRAGEVMR